jgi:hypothetical protein
VGKITSCQSLLLQHLGGSFSGCTDSLLFAFQPVAVTPFTMKLLCFATFFSLSETRIVWVVGNGPLVKFFENQNDVGVTARMNLLENLVFWALVALFILTILLLTIWVVKWCRTKSDKSSKSEHIIGKESVSSTSTTLDISGKFFNIPSSNRTYFLLISDDVFQDDEVFTLPDTKKLNKTWHFPET